MKRTHTCGELTKKEIKKDVYLNGWISHRRDHGGVIFIDLRDRYGITQIVFEPDKKDIFKIAEHLRREDVILINGAVRLRPKGMENTKMDTGLVEVLVDHLEILSSAKTLPLEIDDRVAVNEDVRLKYRYLDLRRPVMQKNILLRHKITKITRDYFDSLNFIEIETPILSKSTPEGARDYLVPSRVNPGKFYALPQSPQLFKQLCMIAGFDRYIQIAKCFRDEDLRADRQPEFTQIDLEMSFIDEQDIYAIIEGFFKKLWKESLNINLKTPFQKIPYNDAMGKYGSDKPDTRFDLLLVDIKDIAQKSDYNILKAIIAAGGSVKAINVKNCGNFTRNDINELTEYAKIYGSKGLSFFKVTEDGLESSIAKFFTKELQKTLIKQMNAENNDLILIVADQKHHVVDVVLGQLRLYLAKKLNLIPKDKWNFLWVVDFPLMEYDENEQRHVSVHHPFTMPKDSDIELLNTDPSKVISKAYDLVLNGVELGGGSIRIHRQDIQKKIFDVLGISDHDANVKFGFLLEALQYGTPPHGGIAFGLDRLAAILSGNESIREVIPFPKTKDAESLMDEAPSEVSEHQLKELHLKLDVFKIEKEQLFRNIIDSLNKEKIDFEIIEHKPVYTSEEAAKARGEDVKIGAKAMICKTNKGFVQAVLSGDKEIDFEKLRKVVSIKSVEMAKADDVKKISGVNIGAVPPFGNLFGLKVFIDKSLSENETVAFNAGSHTKSIKMKFEDLVKVTGARIDDFSKN